MLKVYILGAVSYCTDENADSNHNLPTNTNEITMVWRLLAVFNLQEQALCEIKMEQMKPWDGSGKWKYG